MDEAHFPPEDSLTDAEYLKTHKHWLALMIVSAEPSIYGGWKAHHNRMCDDPDMLKWSWAWLSHNKQLHSSFMHCPFIIDPDSTNLSVHASTHGLAFQTVICHTASLHMLLLRMIIAMHHMINPTSMGQHCWYIPFVTLRISFASDAEHWATMPTPANHPQFPRPPNHHLMEELLPHQ